MYWPRRRVWCDERLNFRSEESSVDDAWQELPDSFMFWLTKELSRGSTPKNLTVVSVRYQRIFLLSLDNETPEVLVSHLVVTNDTSNQSPEDRILDAARRCVERWGINKLTIDDVATEANVSRATLYRIFPGGKDVMFDALRVRELNEFFAGMRSIIEPV